MRISDWSSDVCSSDLDPRSPPTGSLGESGRAQPRSTAAIRCRNDNFTGLKNGSEGPMKLTDVRSTALGLSVAALLAGSAAVAQAQETFINKIGRAHVLTPVTNAHIVCRLMLEKKKTIRAHSTAETNKQTKH